MNSTIKKLDHVDHLCQLYQDELLVLRRNLRFLQENDLHKCCIHTVCTQSKTILDNLQLLIVERLYFSVTSYGRTTILPLGVILEILVYPSQPHSLQFSYFYHLLLGKDAMSPCIAAVKGEIQLLRSQFSTTVA